MLGLPYMERISKQRRIVEEEMPTTTRYAMSFKLPFCLRSCHKAAYGLSKHLD